MKQQLIIFLTLSLITSLQVDAQSCIDTVHIKGYYIIKKKANEIDAQAIRKKDVTILEHPVDVHYDPSFVPCDSITKKHPLSYWLNHFFDDTKQVFISCEKFGIRYFITKECLPEVEDNNNSCSFPELKTKLLYQTTDLNTGDVFEIYYIDAYWAKVKVKKDSPEADIIPSKIAQRCISPSVNEFDLYCFVSYDKVEMKPKIKDPHIKIWKR